MSLRDFDALTFDCYGTLIDWETGILRAVEATLPGVDRPEAEILETFARYESEEEVASPSALYPDILARVHGRLAALTATGTRRKGVHCGGGGTDCEQKENKKESCH